MSIEPQSGTYDIKTAAIAIFNKIADAATAGKWWLEAKIGSAAKPLDAAAGTLTFKLTRTNGTSTWIIGGGAVSIAKDLNDPGIIPPPLSFMFDAAAGDTITLTILSSNSNDGSVDIVVTPQRCALQTGDCYPDTTELLTRVPDATPGAAGGLPILVLVDSILTVPAALKVVNSTSIAGAGTQVADAFLVQYDVANPVFTNRNVNQTGNAYTIVAAMNARLPESPTSTDQLDAAVWAQTRFRMSIPEKVEKPESETIDYTFGISTYDRDGALADCDETPTIHAYYADGSSANAKLGVVTKPDGTTGIYWFIFAVAADDPDYAHVRFVGAAEIDGETVGMTDYTQIVDDASPDFTTGDRETLGGIAEDVAGLDGEIMRGTDGAALASAYTAGRAAKLDNLDAAISTRLPTSGYTAPPSAATIAAAVWVYASRTLTSVSGQVAAIAAAVWTNAIRSLTGSSMGLGPNAAREDEDGYYTCKQGATRGLYRRILGWDGSDLTQAGVTSIRYTIHALSDDDPPQRTAVAGHANVALEKTAVLFDTVQSDEWASNYNFRHVVDVSAHDAFAAAGTSYLVEYKITPAVGQVITQRIVVRAT